ncbi:MAG: type II toxin-antitoxin system Phd/YefM family antitoxin [Clostridiales bacterium]|nr:type II toxin-antitoxin system Phd/YefM family antitoxin [Clostridiales bacterium]HBM81115.1 prevent-host-death family protein [Clostridiaceae bacterium]
MDVSAMEKPNITKDQIVKSSVASKKFGKFRKLAKERPIYISDNGNIDTVLISYDYFEKMYQRLYELEEKEEEMILSHRIEELKNNPEAAVSWKDIRRDGK